MVVLGDTSLRECCYVGIKHRLQLFSHMTRVNNLITLFVGMPQIVCLYPHQ